MSRPIGKSHMYPYRPSPSAPMNTTADVHAIFYSSSFATRSHCLRDLSIRGSLRRLWSTAFLGPSYCHESRSYNIPWPCRHLVPVGAKAGPGFRIECELSIGTALCAFAGLAVSRREVHLPGLCIRNEHREHPAYAELDALAYKLDNSSLVLLFFPG